MKSVDIFKDGDSLQAFIDQVFSDQSDLTRTMNEQVIWRNLLYYCGEQYVEYIPSSGSFRRKITPNYMPTPVSNEIREFVRSWKSLLLNQTMVPRIWPNTSEKEDIDAADVGESLLTWMDNSQDGKFFDEKEKLSIWLALSGTAFMRSYPDADKGMWLPGEDLKTGEVSVECILPFNVRLDTLGDTLDKKRWVGIFSLKSREWVEDTFKVKLELSDGDKQFIDYQNRLAKLVSQVSTWKGHYPITQDLRGEEETDTVLFKEIEFKPTSKYPEGKYAISCGGKVIYKKDSLPIKVLKDGSWFYSLTDFHANYVPGRFWSDPLVNDLISPQNTINEIDQALAINRKGLARPTVLVPGDVGLKRLDMGGHGFLALIYNPIMGAKPEISRGVEYPQQILEERRLQKEQMQDSGGDPKNILRGASPSAQSSGVQLDRMREIVERGKTPDLDRFNRALGRVYKKRLLLAQQLYTEQRIIKVVGRGQDVKVMKFKASDLRNNTDVRLELDSGLITTKAGQAQMLLDMMNSKWLQDPNVSPTAKSDMFKRLGITTFDEEINKDSDRAEDENVRIASLKAGQRPDVFLEEQAQDGSYQVAIDDPLFPYDNHDIHYDIHRKYAIGAEFRALAPELQTIFFEHIDAHQRKIEGRKPDMREYIQIDKLYPLLTRNEQMQVLSDIGIQPDPQGVMAGLPSSDNVVQTKQRIQDTQIREQNKADKIQADRESDYLDARIQQMSIMNQARMAEKKEKSDVQKKST